MEYSSNHEKFSTNPQKQKQAKSLKPDKKEQVDAMLKQGESASVIAEKTGVDRAVVLCERTELENKGEFKFGSWKKHTANLASSIVTKGLHRLNNGGIEEMPIGQVPLAMAILIDKVQVLQDAPTQVVEHRLRVTHEDINKMLDGNVIEVESKKLNPPNDLSKENEGQNS